jgi:hypothetical protein
MKKIGVVSVLLVSVGLCCGGASHVTAQELQGEVPNAYEQAAMARGQSLGIGRLQLLGPRLVEVMSHQSWTLIYTAGRAGLKPGGGIRIGFRHLSNWSPPQTRDPAKAGFMRVIPDPSQPTAVAVDFGAKFMLEHFAWQNMTEIRLPQRGLAPGETIKIVLGDRSGGSPGMRVQPFDESCFIFKTFVDVLGNDEYLPLAESPSIRVVAAAPYRLNVVMPSDATMESPTWCLVRAEDRYGNPATSYRGTVRLTSDIAVTGLPAAYTFDAADQGVHRFEGIQAKTAGVLRVTASDDARQAVGNPVCVRNHRPEELLLWGDLHGHTLLSDGRGTVEEFYDFADRVAGLDFCAVTDHAFEILDEMWEHSKQVTNQRYDPGRFVTFNAFEWSGVTPLGGDHNCYFLDNDPPIFRSTSYYDAKNLQMYHGPTPKQKHITDVFAELTALLKDKNVFCIPHFGGRRGNPSWHDPKVQRMIEIFSEHRRSEDWANTFLTQGYRLGVIASTDGHFGNPGYGYLKPSYSWDEQEIGMAAVAVYAAQRTRESVFRALYDRHVYATSGDRIVLQFDVDGHPMGSECQASSAPSIKIHVVGTAPIQRLEIKKNSDVVHSVQPATSEVKLDWRDEDFSVDKPVYYYLRVVQENGEEAISSPVWVN